MHIDVKINKGPYIRELSNDNVINVTGESGSGKSTYVRTHFSSEEFIIIDTDNIRHNIGLYKFFINKHGRIPDSIEEFDLLYIGILEYYEKTEGKIIVIDSAQFRNIKDIHLLKGKIIILRTNIDTCYSNCINRYKSKHANITTEEYDHYANRKKNIYHLYGLLNDLIDRIESDVL